VELRRQHHSSRYGHTATLLENGNLLIVERSDDGDLSSTLASAELYDATTGTFSITASLNAAPIFHTATLLPDGRVLVTGGYNWPPDSLF
jgi:archaeosine-15-forming tRNA-guanine transglycosylase